MDVYISACVQNLKNKKTDNCT